MKADAHAFILEEGERDGFLDEQKGNKIVVIFTKDFCFTNTYTVVEIKIV